MDKKNQLELLGARFEPVNVNRLRIRMPDATYKAGYSKDTWPDQLESFIYNDVIFNKGDIVELDHNGTKVSYKANYIIVDSKDSKVIHLYEGIYNKATVFALPLLFSNKSAASYIEFNNGIYSGYLINAFIECSFINKQDDNSIFLLLKFSDSDKFKMQEDIFRSHNGFVKSYDINYNHVIYEFSMKEFSSDYQLLKKGKYSELSIVGKNKIVKFHEGTDEAKMSHSVLTKSKKLRSAMEEMLDVNLEGMELFSIFGDEEYLIKEML